jgi:hypothetical protein
MTKAKARERAKAKAGQKVKKREANAAQPEQALRPGQFNQGQNPTASPSVKANAKGAARSR